MTRPTRYPAGSLSARGMASDALTNPGVVADADRRKLAGGHGYRLVFGARQRSACGRFGVDGVGSRRQRYPEVPLGIGLEAGYRLSGLVQDRERCLIGLFADLADPLWPRAGWTDDDVALDAAACSGSPRLPRKERPAVRSTHQTVRPIDPGRAAIGEGGPIVGLAPDQQTIRGPLQPVAVVGVVVLILQALPDDCGDLIVQHPEAKLEGTARCLRRGRLLWRREPGHRHQSQGEGSKEQSPTLESSRHRHHCLSPVERTL